MYNFKIIFGDKNVENTLVKPKAELISVETPCNDSTFVDNLFKSLFKS